MPSASAVLIFNNASASPSARLILASLSASALKIALSFSPSAIKIEDFFSFPLVFVYFFVIYA